MIDLEASLVGNPIETLRLLATWPGFRDDLSIDKAKVDNSPIEKPQWPALLPTARNNAFVFWEEEKKEIPKQIVYRPNSEVVTLVLPNCFSTLDEALRWVEPLPFTLAAFGSPFDDAWHESKRQLWSFGRSAIQHGWGCAFRGAGHDRLVSRRWLDFGPWRVIRRPNDTTFIQFHDLSITDPAEAYAQAAPGHERMGISASGGYIAWHMNGLLEGANKISRLYDPETKLRKILVPPGVEVTQGQMICQCAERLHHRLTQPAVDRIDNVAYIFVDKADAEAHLHELWLRELQCWYLDERGEHRLDADYHPVPNPPAWVRALDGR